MLKFLFICFISISVNISGQIKIELKGKVLSKSTAEALINCNIFVVETSSGTISDSLGNFVLYLRPGKYTIRFSHIGYGSVEKKIELIQGKNFPFLNVDLETTEYQEKEVVITGKKDISISAQTIENKDIKKMPTLYSDVLRTVQSMPGVSSNNELSSGYNVRGGNYDENLIYLNGYEIYRPFLLKMGIEENQSLINPDLVSDLKFYNGSFPVLYGDKMSSVLEVNYNKVFETSVGTVIRANMLNSGLAVNNRIGRLNWAAGIRYAYPGLFLQKLQTQGLYKPTFADIQILMDYEIDSRSNLELFIVNAYNKFAYDPENWRGHFRADRGAEVSEVSIEYSGNSIYNFNTFLLGLRYKLKFDDLTILSLAAAVYRTDEKENKNISGNFFYSPDAEYPWNEREFLKSRNETANSNLNLRIYELKSEFQKTFEQHTLQSGLSLRIASLNSRIDEIQIEEGNHSFIETPVTINKKQNTYLNSVSLYLQDQITLSEKFRINLGLRTLYYFYNDERLISPRALLFYKPYPNHSFNLGFGYYYQPPFFYELRSNNEDDTQKLTSQKAIHYTFSYEFKTKKDGIYLFDFYYKKLSRLIPYYIEQLKLEYLNKNSKDGYSYGFDIQFKGKLREGGLNNWISYSFLNSKERNSEDNDGYNRRLLDQRHTFQVFLQDRIPNHHNWQSHLRLTFGSGYLTHYYRVVKDENTGKYIMEINYDERLVLPFYARADMGLSTTFTFENARKLIVTLEVQNVFNKYNIAGYNYVQVFKDINWPVSIPLIFSKRFFNLGFEYSF